MGLNIVELNGTLQEQISQLEKVKAQLYREYFKTDFLDEFYAAVEKEFPGLTDLIGRIDYETSSEYDDEGGYYDYISSIDFYTPDNVAIDIETMVEEEASPIYGKDEWEVTDFFRDYLNDEGVELIESYASNLVNPKYKEKFKVQ